MSISASLDLFSSPQGSSMIPAIIEEVGNDVFFAAASLPMREVHAQAQLVAGVNAPVFIQGETGTGKEVLARLMHKLSSRAQNTFLKVNCAAIPDELLESELFGYEAGAFTGANRSKPGQFELCNRGTILLDEIGEISPRLQAKLLHVLQDKEFCRFGGRSIVRVDARIIAATNVDVMQAIETNKLRQDLYYRLSAFTIHLPPLRERTQDIPLLFEQFMIRFSRRYQVDPLIPSASLMEACMRYAWPGNVRQLENLVTRFLISGKELLLIKELKSAEEKAPILPVNIVKREGPPGDLKSMVQSAKEHVETEAIQRALEWGQLSCVRAAGLLNISPKALRYKAAQYGIPCPRREGKRGPATPDHGKKRKTIPQ